MAKTKKAAGGAKRIDSRSKGKAGELEFRDVLRSFGWDARRGQQRSGVDQADVIGGPEGVHFEVKRVEMLRLWPAVAQATRDAPPGSVPVVVHRRSRSGWVAILPVEALLEALRALEWLTLVHGPLSTDP